jgi:hypothetical protein
MLKDLIDRDQLRDLTTKTIGFLSLASQPSSALTTDLKILKHTAEKIGLFQHSGLNAGSSFGSTPGGDVSMAGY